MSTAPRGRHRAARHAAPKKKVVSGKHLGALVSVAGMSSVVATSGSTVAGVVQTGDTSVLEYPAATVTAAGPQAVSASIQTSTSRAQAASRSDDRQTLAEAEVVAAAATVDDPTADPNAVIDTTPTVSSTERKSLQALAATTDQLDTLVAQAQDQKNQQAQILLSEQQAAANAKAQAEAAQQAALIEAERLRQIGVIAVPIQANYTLSARYGQRGGIWSAGWHTGLDFRVKSGTPVVAAANGTVIASGWGGAYGYRIEVDHGNGYVTAYNHLSKIGITGGKVAAGQEIGKSGSSGNTTGPHLHFEVTKDGEFMNPSSWLWGN
jgi:murein DD-endopeptidase MepM/ murein hydrolase activator NlpD